MMQFSFAKNIPWEKTFAQTEKFRQIDGTLQNTFTPTSKIVREINLQCNSLVKKLL